MKPSTPPGFVTGRLHWRFLVMLPLPLVIGLMQIALGQDGRETINRREQARAAFLGSPEGIYHQYCAHCHGDDAAGGGRLWATELSPEPPDLTALGQPKEYLVAVIRDGTAAHGKSNLCPPWGRTISPGNVERLAQYIVSVRGEESPASSKSTAALKATGEPLPWFQVGVLFGEGVVIWWMLQPRKKVSNALPEDPFVHR